MTTPSGEVLSRSQVRTSERGGPVSIQLPEHPRQKPAGGMISIRDLKREGNKKLMKEFIAAQEAVTRGDLAGSARHLERAVAIDPGYVPAYVNLGARYLQLRLPNRARGVLLRAIELDPSVPTAYTNLAVADMHMGDPEGAAAAVAAALKVAPGDPIATRLLRATTRAERAGAGPTAR